METVQNCSSQELCEFIHNADANAAPWEQRQVLVHGQSMDVADSVAIEIEEVSW
jgi:hypothetical protein